MATRGRTLLGLIGAGWIGAMIAVWLTHPRHGDGPYTQTLERYAVAAFAVLLVTGVATARALPRPPATTTRAPRAHPDR